MSKIAVEKIREFRAEAKFQRSSPQKVKLILDTIKGMRVEQALNTIHFSTKRMGPVVEKVLRSAIQNATYVSQEQGLDIDVDTLYVRTAVANEGPRMKRIRPAPMGRAFRYQRRLTHIILAVAERASKSNLVTKVEEPETKPEAKAVKTAKTSKAKTGESKPAAKKAAVVAKKKASKKAAVVAKKKASKKA